MAKKVTKKKIDYKNYPFTGSIEKGRITALFVKRCKHCGDAIGISASLLAILDSDHQTYKYKIKDCLRALKFSEAYCKENRGFHNQMEKEKNIYA